MDSKYFLNKKTYRKTLRVLKRVVKLGVKFNLREKIITKNNQNNLIKLIRSPIPKRGIEINKLIKHIENKFLPYCVNQSNSKYIAFPDAGNSIAGLTADTLKPFLNQNLIADVKSAPLGTYLEIQVINWFRELIGYKNNIKFPRGISEIGGVVSFGGVMSNVTSLLVARSKLIKDSFKNGINADKVYILVPDIIDHYSNDLTMGYLGFGAKNVIRIKLNENFTMDLEDLKKKIIKIRKAKGKILAVVAYAGDSRTMQIDNFLEISKICKKNNLWFHIDACHGGVLLFSNKQKNRLNGIEHADSITLDPHKSLMVPYPCSLALFKNPSDLQKVSKNFDMTIKDGTYDLGQITPFIGSKSFESFKLWLLLKNIGTERLGKFIDLRRDLIKNFKNLIDNDSDFISLNEVNMNGLVFLFFPEKLQKEYLLAGKLKKIEIEEFLDSINKKIHDYIYSEGKVCIHTFKIKDVGNYANLRNSGKRQVLGIILGNPKTNKKDLKEIFQRLKLVSRKVYMNNIIN